MALSKLTTVLNTISTMDTVIRDQASTVKADLEHDVNVVKDFINNTLTPEIDILDAENVKKTGDQTIDGVKTFVKSPIVPAPTEDMQPTTKKYVDDKANVHKESADHDSRYFTETELGSIVDSDSGANKIGVTPIPTLAGENAQAVLESIKGRLDNIGETNTNVELSNSHYGANGQTYASVGARCDSIDAELVEVNGTLAQTAKQVDLNATNAEVALKLNRDEIGNDGYPLEVADWTYLYDDLPAASETNKSGYLYCTDGDVAHGAGKYYSNGTSWYFGGTGDQGYNILKVDLDELRKDVKTLAVLGNGTYAMKLSKNIPYIVRLSVSGGNLSVYSRKGVSTTNVDTIIQNISGIYETQYHPVDDFEYVRFQVSGSCVGTINFERMDTLDNLYNSDVMIEKLSTSIKNRKFNHILNMYGNTFVDSGSIRPNFGIGVILFDVREIDNLNIESDVTPTYYNWYSQFPKLNDATYYSGRTTNGTKNSNNYKYCAVVFLQIPSYVYVTDQYQYSELNDINELNNTLDKNASSLANPLLKRAVDKGISDNVLFYGGNSQGSYGWRTPSCIIANDGSYIIGAANRIGESDSAEAKIVVARIKDGNTVFTTLFEKTNYVYGNLSFVIDRTGVHGTTGRIIAFTYEYATGTDFNEQNSTTVDCIYKYSDDNGITWSTYVSIKNKWNLSLYKHMGNSPTNGIQSTDGSLYVPAMGVNLEGEYISGVIFKKISGEWSFSVPTLNIGDNESTVYEKATNQIMLNCRYESTESNERHLYKFYDSTNSFVEIKLNFDPIVNCEMSIINTTINSKWVYLMSFPDSSDNGLLSLSRRRDRPTLWASYDGLKWIRVYRASDGANSGYTCISSYNNDMIFCYETYGVGGIHAVSLQSISSVIDDVKESLTKQYSRNIEYRLQEVIDTMLLN